MTLQIKTLSPIHIGNGEKYNGLSYIQDKRQTPIKLCYLEFDTLQKTLTQQQLQSFAEWVVTERFPNLYKLLKNILNDRNNSLTNNLISKSLYKVDILYKEDPLQRRFLGDIEAFIKQNNQVYIPGTEIKGAIRTALLYNFLQMDINWKWLKDEIEKFAKRHKDDLQQVAGKKGRVVNDIKKKLVADMGKLEERLQTQLLRPINHDDAKYDLLKLFHLGDSELKNSQSCLFISNLKVEGINRSFPIFQELCKKDQIFTCQGFKLDNNKTIIDKLGFNDEQKWVVLDIKNIFQCCYEFSNRLLNEELNYFNNNQAIKTKLQAIKERNKPDSPVIRIGKNEGYLSLTMGLLVKDKDKTLYDNVLCHATKNTSYTGDFPKTRRVVNLEDGNIDTCGWVKLAVSD